MLRTLKTIVEDRDTRAGRVFDTFVQLLIVCTLVTYAVETLPRFAGNRWLKLFEVVAVGLFTIEYGLRWLVADKKTDFIFSFYGIVDFLAVAPFYFGFNSSSLRVLRLFRLFRALKLIRYSKAIQRFHMAFSIAKEEIVLFLLVTLFLLYFASVGIYHFEHEAQPEKFKSVFHSLWWAVCTLTTVGYGDVYPITVGGRVFTFVVLVVGLGVVSVPAGLLASALSEARELCDKDDGAPDKFERETAP